MNASVFTPSQRTVLAGGLSAGPALLSLLPSSRTARAANFEGDGNHHKIPIVDCHAHFIDARQLHYPVFAQRRAGFEALVGDYTSMARTLLPEDYARDTAGMNVVKVVGEEFLSSDPFMEVRWMEKLADTTGRPNGIVALADFLNPTLDQTLDSYAGMSHVRAVRQHMGWHPTNSLINFALRPDLLSDPVWRNGLSSLRGRNLRCELEVYSPQLQDLAAVATAFPDVLFILPMMGWPTDLTSTGRGAWIAGMKAVGACPNVAVKIFGMEMIFGLQWTVQDVRSWILQTIDVFGPSRTMFGSHMPICQLACSFQHLYDAYFQVIAAFSPSEKRQMLHDTAIAVYGLT